MAGITKEQRYQSWNVQIFVDSKLVAGLYQRDNLLRVADIAHEVELCLIFDKPADDTPWQPALLPMNTTSSLIILNHQDELPFPTPMADDIKNYTYVFHSSHCTRGDLHSLAGIVLLSRLILYYS